MALYGRDERWSLAARPKSPTHQIEFTTRHVNIYIYTSLCARRRAHTPAELERSQSNYDVASTEPPSAN